MFQTFVLKVVGHEEFIQRPDCQDTKLILGQDANGCLWKQEQNFLKVTESNHFLCIKENELCLDKNSHLAWKFFQHPLKFKRNLGGAICIAQENDMDTIQFELERHSGMFPGILFRCEKRRPTT